MNIWIEFLSLGVELSNSESLESAVHNAAGHANTLDYLIKLNL